MVSPQTAARVGGIAAALITGILLLAAAILFVGLYLLFPTPAHAPGLIAIGVLGVAFALISYLLESVSRTPSYQRATAWGFYAFGFAVLFLSFGINPGAYLDLTAQIVALVVTLLFLAGSVAGIAWRYRSRAEVVPREAAREAWRKSEPMSAFEYPTARNPSPPATAPSPADANPSRPRGGA